ncbi:MAG: protein translocase subunit SecF [SAR324 cluster bacterium]|nr:protein translocase subunit SecF [SAR324 cluster bacterium]
MKFIKDDLHLDFLGKWKPAALLSTAVLVAGIAVYFPIGGLNYGIDFLGGTLVQVRFPSAVNIGEVRSILQVGDFGSFELQSFGEEDANEVLITLAGSQQEETIEQGQSLAQRVGESLEAAYPGIVTRRVESVGPKVGQELKEAAAAAIVFALLAILGYVWLRFQWRYGIAAVAATIHDVFFLLALFVFLQSEITLPVVAAILTIAGYSINDSIVILDRIRDNVRRFQNMAFREIINDSLNQTMSRTLLTSMTTLLVVVSIYVFGGAIIRDFAFVLIVGVLIGTYSSIFIASPLLLLLHHRFPIKAK